MGLCCRAVCVSLLFVCVAGDAQAQAPADTKRIEQMRDQASAPTADATDTLASDAADRPDQAVAEAERSLPPNELLPLGAGDSELFGGETGQSSTGSLGDGWLLSTLAALGVVLALVFGIRWVLRRGGVVSTSVPQGSVVEVLSRTTVAPRSHVVLMRVGARVLVVSDSSAGMRTLASVNDAEEVAELLGAIDAGKPTSMSQGFGSVMKKLSGQWSGDDRAFEEDAGLEQDQHAEAGGEQARGALSRVRGRLAALSDAGGKA